MPVDLTKLFKGSGLLPSVVTVFEQSGSWDVPGQSRNVKLSDGSVLSEQITSVVAPGGNLARFEYVVKGFSGAIGSLTNEARGVWQFETDGANTIIHWTYGFLPRNKIAGVALAGVVRFMWRSYMQRALVRMLDIIKRDAQN